MENHIKVGNLPTAKEFLKESIEDIYKGNVPVEHYLIEFAKLHVKAALKAASEKVDLTMYKKSNYSLKPRWKRVSKKEANNGVNLFSYEVEWRPSRSSILKAYPENLIK